MQAFLAAHPEEQDAVQVIAAHEVDRMTGPGRYHFVAWSRHGIAAKLDNPDYGGPLPVRGTITVELNVTADGPSPDSQPVPTVTVHTYGPGDVLGIDPRHVIRTEPKDRHPTSSRTTSPASSSTCPTFPGCSRRPHLRATGSARGSR